MRHSPPPLSSQSPAAVWDPEAWRRGDSEGGGIAGTEASPQQARRKATKKNAKKAAAEKEEPSLLITSLNFSLPFTALRPLLDGAGLLGPAPASAGAACTEGGEGGEEESGMLPEPLQDELDTPDQQVADLWALNLEEQQNYRLRADAPPGGPRFRAFMEKFEREEREKADSEAEAEAAEATEAEAEAAVAAGAAEAAEAAQHARL